MRFTSPGAFSEQVQEVVEAPAQQQAWTGVAHHRANSRAVAGGVARMRTAFAHWLWIERTTRSHDNRVPEQLGAFVAKVDPAPDHGADVRVAPMHRGAEAVAMPPVAIDLDERCHRAQIAVEVRLRRAGCCAGGGWRAQGCAPGMRFVDVAGIIRGVAWRLPAEGAAAPPAGFCGGAPFTRVRVASRRGDRCSSAAGRTAPAGS